jgi:molecular chaperone HscC
VIGIDLGTTYSLVSHLDGEHPVVLPNALGELLTPSAVSIDDDGSVLVGAAARARAVTHADRTCVAFKRDMGTDRSTTLAGRTFTPIELSALVLGALKQDAEAALGGAIDEAVVTVPAYFGERQRQATRDAATLAGLKVERMINEPTAAALAYGLHARGRDASIVVLDLGGGTFDVTILEIVDGVIEVQASAGDARLGGEDFVDALVVDTRARIEREHGRLHASAEGALREACELAKRRLSTSASTDVTLPALRLASERTIDVSLPIDRALADRLFEPLFTRMRAPIQRALSDARKRPGDLAEVLLVGGATRMPQVAQLAAKTFGRMPLRTLPPDEAVALGAAVQAALVAEHAAVEDVVVTDVAPFTLGIATAERAGRAHVGGLFTPILERGTTIPASRVQRFFAIGPSQDHILIEVYQGEHSLCRDNTKLAEFRIDGLPHGGPEPASIDVRFTYDPSGLLEVDVDVGGTGKKHHRVIEERPGRLRKSDLTRIQAALARLKFHPRDALPNRTALARAEALFTQLSGPPRDALGDCLRAFHVALESQNTPAIERWRGELATIVARLSRPNG